MTGGSPIILPETKVCKTCGVPKNLGEFYPNPHCKYDRAPECAECVRKRKKMDYQKLSPGRKRELSERSKVWHREHLQASRDARLRYAYGLDDNGVAQLYAKQDGICPVCGKPLPWAEKNIDHDHRTNTVRGLTHSYCNTGVGFLDNYKDRIPEILAYLGLK